MSETFEGLTPQEARLVQCATAGEWWTPESAEWTEFDADPAYAYGWNQDRTIRAKLIRCLVTGDPWPGCKESWAVHSKGLMALGARIQGPLDLEGAILETTLWLHDCAFTGPIILMDAKCRTISLQRSHLPFGLSATRMQAKGAVNLSAVMTQGEIHLTGARIEDQLVCDGGHFENASGTAINGNAMIVGASVFFRDSFIAKGQVNLLRAKIEGQLSCRGGRFENPGGRALNGSAMTVSADMFLSDGFSAAGEVRLVRARIDGQLSCEGGHFENPGNCALDGDAMAVGTDLFLRDGFSAKGKVDFTKATIGGGLQCIDATFDHETGDALNLALSNVGALILKRFRALNGRVVLEQAKCRTYSDDSSARPAQGKLVLDGFAYERFHDCTKYDDRLAWLRLQPDDHLKTSFRPQPWTQAIKVLRDMGHDDNARDLAIEREIARSASTEIGQTRRVWLWLQRYTTGFGYRPQYALVWSLAVFLTSWLVFATAANLGFMAPRDGSVVSYLAAHPGAKLPEHYTRFNAPIYAFDNYLPIIELGQDQAWEPSDVQSGYRRVTNDGWLVEGVRLALGHDWSITSAAANESLDPVLPVKPVAVATSGDPGLFDGLADGEAWLFRHGFHRFVYWAAEILGWIFVSLYIAGMSGIMKED